MSDEQKQEAGNPEPQDMHVEFIGSDTAPAFYANNMNLQVSPWDMRIQFSQLQQSSKPGTVTYRTVATVYLTPGQARALHAILARKIDKYEAVWSQQDQIIEKLGQDEKAE